MPRQDEDTPGKAHTSVTPGNGSFNWHALTSLIRNEDPAGEDEFIRAYGRGIEIYLRRNLGFSNLKDLTRETLRTSIEGIRQGWLKEPRDLVSFLRRTVQQKRLPDEGSSERPGGTRAKSELLERQLRLATSREREMLIRYYLYGQSMERIQEEMGADGQEFLALKARVRQAVEERPEEAPAVLKKAPATV